MRYAVWTAFALAAGLFASSAVFAADPAKLPDGFRGIPWGARLDTLPQMTAVEREGDVAHCDRAGEKKTLGPIETRLIDYSFYKDRFYHAAIIYERGFDVIQETLQDKYGPPDATRVKKDADGREYVLAEWVWPGQVYIGHRRFTDEDGGRIFYFYSPLADESMGRKTQPAKAGAKNGPKPGVHVVKKGETLGGVAARYGVSLSALRAANGGLDPKKLKLGQELVIPGAGKAAERPLAEAPRSSNAAVQSAQEATDGRTLGEASKPAGASPGDAAAKPAPEAAEDAAENVSAAAAAATKQAQTAVPEGGAGSRRYAVAQGDVFSAIAKRFGVSQTKLAKANPGVNPKKLSIGQTLIIPASSGAGAATPAKDAQTAGSGTEAPAGAQAGTTPETPTGAPGGPSEEKAQAASGTPRPESAEQAVPKAPAEAKTPEASAPAEAAKAEPDNASPTRSVLKHVIAPGDTIGALAKRYGVTEKAILRANKIKNPKGLQLGQTLTIPAPVKK